ncbi:MAG: right-handed parallel beta-helix repeat-containing protein [Candidatus Kerfeldbacteria bacterium]
METILKQKRFGLATLVVLCVLVLLPKSASATELWVDSCMGDDDGGANDCQTEALPCATLGQAVSEITANNGDQVWATSGCMNAACGIMQCGAAVDFTEMVSLGAAQTGNGPGNQTRFDSWESAGGKIREMPVIDCENTRDAGFWIGNNPGDPANYIGVGTFEIKNCLNSGVIGLPNSNYGDIEKVYSHDNAADGIRIDGSTAWYFYVNTLTDNGGYGIHYNSAINSKADANLISGNDIGIYMSVNSTGHDITNNWIEGSTSYGIQVVGNSNNIVNNTTYENGTGEIRVGNDVDAPVSNTTILNNILNVQSNYGIMVECNANTNLSSNFNDIYRDGGGMTGWWGPSGGCTGINSPNLGSWQANSGGDANSIETDPDFTNPGVGPAINATSPAVNTGTDASAWTTTDIHAQSRPIGAGWEMGADERYGPAEGPGIPEFSLVTLVIAFGLGLGTFGYVRIKKS